MPPGQRLKGLACLGSLLDEWMGVMSILFSSHLNRRYQFEAFMLSLGRIAFGLLLELQVLWPMSLVWVRRTDL